MAKIKAGAGMRGTMHTNSLPAEKELKELVEEEYALERSWPRMFGNIKFIGELFLRGMVSGMCS